MLSNCVAVLLIFLAVGRIATGQELCRPNAPRHECGYHGITPSECEGRGCCWEETEDQPSCYYKSTAQHTYQVEAVSAIELGLKMSLKAISSPASDFGEPISPLGVDIIMQSEQRLHVKIYDMNKPRWEIPPEVSPPGSLPSFAPNKPLYNYTTAKRGEYFYFAVNRVSDGEVLFNTSFIDQPLEFADQFLSIATTLPGNEVLYGLGERKASLALEKGKTYTLWSFDSSFDPGVNLYGSHPFYMDLRQSGKAHSVYLRNSNGMDVVYGDNFLTYRVIGGLLDFYFFLGPTPELVLQQYQEVIGAPRLPPYWALGFHQCRYGYHSVEALYEVITNFTTNKIPLDGIWSDIDYMNEPIFR